MTSLKREILMSLQVKTRRDLFRVNMDLIEFLRLVFQGMTHLYNANFSFLLIMIGLEKKTDIIKQFAHEFGKSFFLFGILGFFAKRFYCPQ